MSDVTRILFQIDVGGRQAAERLSLAAIAPRSRAGPKTVHNSGVMLFLAASVLALTIPAIVCGAEPVVYERDVKPILQARCVACHGLLKQEAGLRLDTAALAIKGGESGAAIKVGEPSASRLIERISATDEAERMPPEGEPLKPEQIALLGRWIAEGAKAPADEAVADPRKHWAFQPPHRSALPLNSDSASRNPIDAFIDAEHKRLGLTPLPEAEKSVLLRRLYLDLVGVPPSRDELREYLADERPDAYERVVDRLLASPLHAQRWARHWMDIWRYSDWYGSRDGNELRNSRRHIWRWRDWIVDAVASDKPYDRQLLEMLAADELAPGDQDAARAGGYLGRSYYVFNRHVWLHDTTEFTAASFLALTLKCCRCHDHKYDPLAQEEYFRLRAFFEPHNVRTDQLPGKPGVISGNWPTGAPPGAAFKHGFDVAYDADLAAPTYLLERGNEKNPRTDKPLTPGVPAILGKTELAIEPVLLPVEAYYPDLRPAHRQDLLATATAAVGAAEAALNKARQGHEEVGRQLELTKLNSTAVRPAPFLEENFTAHDKAIWKPLSGEWQFVDGRLKLSKPGHFSTIATASNHPRDFKATLKYRTLSGGSIGSIGLFFDMVELQDAQAVYTHVNASSSGVQAFHRQNGQETYPDAGIVKTPLKLEEETTLEITVRGQELKIWLNGEFKLTYAMPLARRDGRFALWGHEGVAEFLSLKIVPLSLTLEDLTSSYSASAHEVLLAQQRLDNAKADEAAIAARIAAEVAKYGGRADEAECIRLAREASRLERAVALGKAQLELLTAVQRRDIAKAAAKSDDSKSQQGLTAAKAGLAAATNGVESAKANLAKEETSYQPLGPVYPTTSSGRRLALARWIVSRENPLTARVAVNHVWKRHFGTALVPSVANFGLNGKPPTHPQLLDYLAVEFVENGWSQRGLHRLIVTSAAYRRASDEAAIEKTAHNGKVDRDNKYLWRMNLRRMEAEVVRDSLWSLTGDLDSSVGGPELEPRLADSSPRRSLYFRITPDDQAAMLELFDGAAPAECFERTESIVPQQALALANGPIATRQSRQVARALAATNQSDGEFIRAAFEHVLTRAPHADELASCQAFLQQQTTALAEPARLTKLPSGAASAIAPAADPSLRARESLVHVLLNHHDFVTVR